MSRQIITAEDQKQIDGLVELHVDPDCKHHWRITPPTGKISVGRCRKCGGLKEFKNSIQTSAWLNTKGKRPKRASRRS